MYCLFRQKATKAKHLQKELADLFNKRLKGEMETKQYILQKRQLEKQVKDIKLDLRENNLEHLADPNFWDALLEHEAWRKAYNVLASLLNKNILAVRLGRTSHQNWQPSPSPER